MFLPPPLQSYGEGERGEVERLLEEVSQELELLRSRVLGQIQGQLQEVLSRGEGQLRGLEEELLQLGERRALLEVQAVSQDHIGFLQVGQHLLLNSSLISSLNSSFQLSPPTPQLLLFNTYSASSLTSITFSQPSFNPPDLLSSLTSSLTFSPSPSHPLLLPSSTLTSSPPLAPFQNFDKATAPLGQDCNGSASDHHDDLSLHFQLGAVKSGLADVKERLEDIRNGDGRARGSGETQQKVGGVLLLLFLLFLSLLLLYVQVPQQT